MAVRQDAIRAYYNAALDEPSNPTDNTVWSGNQAITKPILGPLTKFALGTSGIAAAGFLPFRGGRVWDKYVSGLRHFEEYFFGRIPRTLQLSNIFSQFESAAIATRTITSEQLGSFSGGQLNYLEKLTGTDAHVMMREGLRFEGGKLSLGQSGTTLLSNASIIRNVNKSHHFSSSYARSLGTDITNNLFSESIPFTNAKGEAAEEIFQIIGGNSKGQAIKRQLFGYGTEMVERANRLAKAPFDFPVIGPLLQKIAGRNVFGVRSGSGLQTLGRLAGKFGIVGGAAVLGYETADWAVRNAALFDSTIFDQGITAGAATLWAKGSLAYAKFGEATGWTDSAKRQEEYAPGSTSLLKLSAFPMMGVLGGASLHYIQRAMLTARFQSKGRRIERAADLAARVLQRFEGTGIVSTLGKSFRESGSAVIRSLGRSPLTVMASVGAAIGTLPVLPFLFNALAPGQSEQELHDLYSGRTEVAVKRSRFWEMGRTPYEGTSIDYYRPHWYARMIQRGKEKSIWGGEDDSPLTKWYKTNFTYDLEQRHYYDRPYPVSGRAFYDVPIIGPALSATLGRLIKPERYMHTDEFYRGGAYQHLAPGFGQDRALGLGEELPGSPMSPHSLRGTIGEQAYRLTELSGLPGFLATSIKQSITGTQDLFDQQSQLQSADLINSAARDYWDLNLGGMAGTNELFRRLLPHKRNQIETYNPIRNTMPDWLPGEGQRGPDLLHGDPYAKVTEGEIRLPGEGYATRFKELAGLNPADYPLVHKYKILADIAPFTDQFADVEQQAAIAFGNKEFSKEEEAIYHQAQDQLQAKRNKRVFSDYKYRDKELDPVQQALADWNEKQKEDSGPSWFQKTLGSYWETLAHNAETPLEFLTPLSPGAKLVHMRTALEDYKQNQVYGTESAFWDRPWSNFLRPFMTSTANLVDEDTNIPSYVQDKRNLESYFDVLKYVKFSRLKNVANAAKDTEAASEFEQKRRETLFGVNPYTFDYTEIFRALPRRDRDYFNAFVKTKDLDERAEILKLVPENEKGLYIAKWRQSDATDYARAVKLGVLSDAEVQKGEQQLKEMYDDMGSEGLPKDKNLFNEYISTRLQGESYADWYRRTKLLAKKVDELGINIPGPDWCFPPGALVNTAIGYRPIEQISENDLVFTTDGLHKVVTLINRPVDEKLVRVTWSQDTCSSMLLTTNHPVWSNGVFVPAGKLCVGDTLFPYQILEPEAQSLDIINYLPTDKYKLVDNQVVSKVSGPKQCMSNTVKMSDDIYWLMGWFLAEGNIRCCEDRMRGIEFTLAQDELHIADKICKVVQDNFNIASTPKFRNRETGDCISVIIHSQILAYLFQRLCGRFSDKKVAGFPGSKRQQLIAALAFLDGDGSFEDNRAVLNTTSKPLALWFRDVLSNHGYKISMRCQMRENRKPSYRVSWLKNKRPVERTIASIEFIDYKGLVFNLSVEGQNEFYVDFGLVHNCGWHPAVDLDDIKLKVVHNLGESIQDYDLWPTREKALLYKQAFINDEAVEPVTITNQSSDIRKLVQSVLTEFDIEDTHIDVTMMSGNNHRINMDIQEDRTAELKQRLRDWR